MCDLIPYLLSAVRPLHPQIDVLAYLATVASASTPTPPSIKKM